MPASLTLVRMDLPTPDVVLVRVASGHLILFADDRVPDDFVLDAARDVQTILDGEAYPLISTA